MLERVPRALFHLLASSRRLKTLASRYGLRKPTSFARRFIAGETPESGIAAARQLESRGLLVSLDLLGESVTTAAAADTATREYLEMIEAVVESGIGRNLSLKLTQLGLDVDRATATDNLRRILERADRHSFFVRIDMENSSYTDVTLDIFETLWHLGHRYVGVVLQAALRRTPADLQRVNRLGAGVRLVKGAYKEPKHAAFQAMADVDAAFVELMETLLAEGTYPAIATHDPAMIEATRKRAAAVGRTADTFEFQMLYGVRRDLQASLVAEGYRVRVYIPFGREWFPYFMRRLGERPANVAFVLRSLWQEA
jgi:proline dehydrogenase